MKQLVRKISSQKKKYVTLIEAQPKNPPTVERLTNQLMEDLVQIKA